MSGLVRVSCRDQAVLVEQLEPEELGKPLTATPLLEARKDRDRSVFQYVIVMLLRDSLQGC